MITLLSDPSEEIVKFRSAPWQLQTTFPTPLKKLNEFVAVPLSLFRVDSGTLSTDLVVFEPEELLQLMDRNSIKVENHWKFSISAAGQTSVAELLEAALGVWADFLFVSTAASFAIYADHDEYTTFYAQDLQSLELLTKELERAGFSPVEYRRGGAVDHWR